MDSERKRQRDETFRKLRWRGYFIAAMGVIGLTFYILDIAESRNHPIIVIFGTIFCIAASWRMFYLASIVRHRRD